MVASPPRALPGLSYCTPLGFRTVLIEADGLFDFLAVGIDLLPSGFEIEDADSRVVLEQFQIPHTGAASVIQHPDGDAGHANAGLATADAGRVLDSAG